MNRMTLLVKFGISYSFLFQNGKYFSGNANHGKYYETEIFKSHLMKLLTVSVLVYFLPSFKITFLVKT